MKIDLTQGQRDQSSTDPVQGQSQAEPKQSAQSARRQIMRLERNWDVARFYGEHDTPVFPCVLVNGNNKRPAIKGWQTKATTDLRQINRWWAKWPDALVAIPTGPSSGIWVLDVDGEIGLKNLETILVQLGVQSPFDLTPCISRTPSGGIHLIFRLKDGERPRNRANDIAAKLDTRGVKEDGTSAGYIIAPGTWLADGRRYSWETFNLAGTQ